ncbi:SIR2 family protein [Pantoea endophytica]|uniref:SIR2 family protein n=1 Tax=Pantoea endophytica TaxID=92488 RepID=UPI002413B8F9|nr:SIR2 family protein [Pantoea endophytica]
MLNQSLLDAIKEKKLVVFIGAGFSRSSGIPDWKTMVSDILYENSNYIDKSAAYVNALRDEIMSPLEVLDKIKNEKKLVLQGFEKKTNLSNYESDNHKLIGKISKKIITTNFDKLIENNIPIKTVITQTSDYNLSKIDIEEEYLLKIHGDISQADSCVIFSEQFEELYNNKKLAEFQLQKIFSSNSVLFIGFSFEDPFVSALFEYISQLYNGFGQRHFIISTEDKNINNLITIKINNYSELPKLLAELVNFNSKSSDTLQNDSTYISIDDGSDLPPVVGGWVGREKEIAQLNLDLFKVFFITGMGGEGKSALAAHFLSVAKDKNDHLIYDWRDFKEEDQKFHHKISSMIRIVSSNFNYDELIGLSDESLINIFFTRLKDKNAIFILDNIDSYIDLDKFEPIGGIGKLVNASLIRDHSAKFIFTCRPTIHFANVNFYQMSLSGLSVQNTIDFFTNSGVSLSEEKINKYAQKAHQLTNGHALWLSLIIAQAKRGEEKLSSFLEGIESRSSVDLTGTNFLSDKVLDSIWLSLNDRDQKLLRVMAESVRAETAEDYAEIIRDELSYNKFSKALSTLRNMNLIISKVKTEFIELHPLVKEYVRKNHSNSDRNKFIYLLVKYYDKFIVVFRGKLSHKLTFEELTHFTRRAELSINAGDYQDALNSLREVHLAISGAGYTEEFLRVCKLLVNAFSWSKSQISLIQGFDEFVQVASQTAIEYGDNEFNDKLLNKYEFIVEGKGEEYIRLCKMKGFTAWVKGDSKQAINICEEALYYIDRANLADNYNFSHDYALALRDSKIIDNVDKAIPIFLKKNELKSLTDINAPLLNEDRGTIYGNVGKCLFIKGDLADALTCYYKSFYCNYLDDTAQRMINLGFASKWIFEALLESKKPEEAIYFYMYSLFCWKESSPFYYNQLSNDCTFDELRNSTLFDELNKNKNWKIEKYCLDYISNVLSLKL